MNAEIKPGYATDRQILADILPLEAPLSLDISPTHVCNFHCFYCTHGKTNEEKAAMNLCQQHLDFELFDKIARDAEKFNGKIKRVIFTGMGEPLANPRLPDMLKILKSKNVAEKYEMFTNGYLLTHEMSDRLIDAGLTLLRVSIQGLTARKYKEVTGVDIDFNRLKDNIAYFYKNRRNCKVYIKIIDECLSSDEDEESFYEMFGDMSDYIYVEHLSKLQHSMAESYDEDINNSVTLYGKALKVHDVCAVAFYHLQIDSLGNTFPCCPLGFPESFSLGNVKEESLCDIWNGEKLRNFRICMLKNGVKSLNICDKCESYLCFSPEEDNLDDRREELIKRFEEMKCQK